MLPKERHDRLQQIASFADAKPVNVLPVVVVTPVNVHRADAEEICKQVEAIDALRALSHCKLVRNLKPGSISPATHSIGLSNEIDRETTLAVNKAGNPANVE